MISVCLATYNGAPYIAQQLRSILHQLGSGDEVIVSDDSSTDQTVDIVKSLGDSRIRLFEKGTFRSPIFNFEFALRQAQGDLIFLSDQDDAWLPERVSMTLALLAVHDLVVCNGLIVDQEEQLIHPSYFEWKGSRAGFWKNLAKNSYLGCSLAFNRKVLNRVLPFPRHIIMHDLWIGLIGECVGRVYFLDEPLFKYRRHQNNFTAAITKADHALSDFPVWFKVWYRVVMLWYVVWRLGRGRSKRN